jgi:8-amino-7-oxononanoate synthase
MDLFAKCHNPRLEEYRAAQNVGLMPFFFELDAWPGNLIMLGSNNYLGLAHDPRVRKAAAEALETFGTGCTGSRLMNGTLSLHRQLEEELADWMGTESCLVFTTGYSVNLGTISTLVGPRDLALVDAASHASVVDGARLCPGRMRSFGHNSVSSLRRRLKAWTEQEAGGALVVVEGVYSMEGDLGVVEPVVSACREMGARVLVDEAHSLGVIGPKGAGTAAQAGVRPDLLMGTFSKSLASCGGFLAGPHEVIEYMRIACRSFLFTASGVPAAVAAALCATRIARDEEWRREAVTDRARQLHRGLAERGFQVGEPPPAAIVPVVVGDDWRAALLWRALLEAGVYTNCCVAPAVSKSGALLRCSVEATQDESDIERALRAFEVARSKLD